MPPSALEDLSQNELENSMEISAPFFARVGRHSYTRPPPSSNNIMVFEISTEKGGRRSYCGVEEFTAPENHVIIPDWILSNLGAAEGSAIQIRRVQLPNGTFLRLQPHTSEFLEVNDTKAMLEWVLPRFVVLSVG